MIQVVTTEGTRVWLNPATVTALVEAGNGDIHVYTVSSGDGPFCIMPGRFLGVLTRAVQRGRL